MMLLLPEDLQSPLVLYQLIYRREQALRSRKSEGNLHSKEGMEFQVPQLSCLLPLGCKHCEIMHHVGWKCIVVMILYFLFSLCSYICLCVSLMFVMNKCAVHCYNCRCRTMDIFGEVSDEELQSSKLLLYTVLLQQEIRSSSVFAVKATSHRLYMYS